MRYQAALFTEHVFFIERMGWLTRLELATTGITIRGSTN
ncbi:hypothetical protein VPUCM_0043 [Vibrio parahaemolyticus UCM-V493]|nr:hypothetical protein VPUCM_0043 [Vibrio parahaemolyticus UCM-V493]